MYYRIKQINKHIVNNRGKKEKYSKFEMGCVVQSRKWCKRHWTAEARDLPRDLQTPALEPLVSMTEKNNRWQEGKAVPWDQGLREGGYIFSFLSARFWVIVLAGPLKVSSPWYTPLLYQDSRSAAKEHNTFVRGRLQSKDSPEERAHNRSRKRHCQKAGVVM